VDVLSRLTSDRVLLLCSSINICIPFTFDSEIIELPLKVDISDENEQHFCNIFRVLFGNLGSNSATFQPNLKERRASEIHTRKQSGRDVRLLFI
jgi:hypothetical protein